MADRSASMFASPSRVDNAMAMRSNTSSLAEPEALVSFAEVLSADRSRLFVGGHRVSGVRRSQYSYREHFQAWNKVLRTVVNLLKLLTLLIVYFIVKHIEVTQKADVRRQQWTCSFLLFYNQTFLVGICLLLAYRVSKNESLALGVMVLAGFWLAYFAVRSLSFFVWGFNLYQDLPDGESNKLPESTLLYAVFLLCFTANLFCIAVMLYVFCYVAAMTYQLRGVLFAEDNQTQASSLRLARQASNMRRLEALRSHKKPIVSRIFLRSDLTCTVCLCEFAEKEEIVVLECHKSHIYHLECIESWI